MYFCWIFRDTKGKNARVKSAIYLCKERENINEGACAMPRRRLKNYFSPFGCLSIHDDRSSYISSQSHYLLSSSFFDNYPTLFIPGAHNFSVERMFRALTALHLKLKKRKALWDSQGIGRMVTFNYLQTQIYLALSHICAKHHDSLANVCPIFPLFNHRPGKKLQN